jgi:hypothetical protein
VATGTWLVDLYWEDASIALAGTIADGDAALSFEEDLGGGYDFVGEMDASR